LSGPSLPPELPPLSALSQTVELFLVPRLIGEMSEEKILAALRLVSYTQGLSVCTAMDRCLLKAGPRSLDEVRLVLNQAAYDHKKGVELFLEVFNRLESQKPPSS